MAEINNEKTIAKPAPEPTFSTSSTGSSATMLKATAPFEVRRRSVPHARPHYCHGRPQSMCVDDRSHCIGGVVEPIDHFKAKRHT